jgi:predicted transposase/invertase (TIGR01784 family)
VATAAVENAGMSGSVDPRTDYVFKRLFGDEDNAALLVDLLNALLFATRRVVGGVMLLNPFVDKDYAQGKVSILDVRARDDPGRLFLLEMQRLLPVALVNRLLYYWAQGHSQQLGEGDRYEMLLPTYSLCFLDAVLFDDGHYHHRFRLYDTEHNALFCRDLEIHLIELPKLNVPVEELKTQEERWLYFLKHGASLAPDRLPATLDVPVIRKAVEVLVKLSQNELERQRAMERERAQRDAWDLVETARVKIQAAEAAQKAMEEAQKANEEAQKANEEAQKANEEAQKANEEAQKALAEALKGKEEALKGKEEALKAAEAGQKAAENATRARQVGPLVGRIQLLERLLGQPQTPAGELFDWSEEDLTRREEALLEQFGGKKGTNGSPAGDRS